MSGVEPDTNLIDPGNPDCPAIYTGNIDETFEPGKKFDWVILLDVLEHIEQPAEVLLHICKHLNPGARLLITVPAFNLLWTGMTNITITLRGTTKRHLHAWRMDRVLASKR